MFSRILSPDIFSSFFGKDAQKNPPGKSPAKSSKIYTTKTPDTFLRRGRANDCTTLVRAGTKRKFGRKMRPPERNLLQSPLRGLVALNTRTSPPPKTWRVPNPPGANPLVTERARWRSSPSCVTGGQHPIGNPYRFLSFLLHNWQPPCESNSHSWGRLFQLPGVVSTRGVRHSPENKKASKGRSGQKTCSCCANHKNHTCTSFEKIDKPCRVLVGACLVTGDRICDRKR